MVESPGPARVYLSYVQSDELYAQQLTDLLGSIGSLVKSYRNPFQADLHVVEEARDALNQCSLVIVLVGPQTRFSRWVDMEMSLACESRRSQAAAGLIGIILPTHSDFQKPYYDPELVPLRLHDRVEWEYAIIRKWTSDVTLLSSWLMEAEQRRHRYQPSPTFATVRQLQVFPWREHADTPRPAIEVLMREEL